MFLYLSTCICTPRLCQAHSFLLQKETDPAVVKKFADKVRANTEKMGAKFVDYEPNAGVWVFEVEHF